jgi:hypothetical protein
MNKLKKAVAVILTIPVWLPVVFFLGVYFLIIDVEKVHKEFEEN